MPLVLVTKLMMKFCTFKARPMIHMLVDKSFLYLSESVCHHTPVYASVMVTLGKYRHQRLVCKQTSWVSFKDRRNSNHLLLILLCEYFETKQISTNIDIQAINEGNLPNCWIFSEVK